MARVALTQTASGVVITCSLSERNAVTLLSKLYTPGSRCELICQDVPVGVACARLRIEPDQQHYNSPSRHGAGPGAMHPVTERILRAVKDAVGDLAITEPDRADADRQDGVS